MQIQRTSLPARTYLRREELGRQTYQKRAVLSASSVIREELQGKRQDRSTN